MNFTEMWQWFMIYSLNGSSIGSTICVLSCSHTQTPMSSECNKDKIMEWYIWIQLKGPPRPPLKRSTANQENNKQWYISSKSCIYIHLKTRYGQDVSQKYRISYLVSLSL